MTERSPLSKTLHLGYYIMFLLLVFFRIDGYAGLRYQVMMNAPLTLTLSHRGARGTKGLPSPTLGRGKK